MMRKNTLAIAFVAFLGLAAAWALLSPLVIERRVPRDPPPSAMEATEAMQQAAVGEGKMMEDPKPSSESIGLPDLGPAPELENEIWLNVDHPLRLAELRGSVVALDMWTFG